MVNRKNITNTTNTTNITNTTNTTNIDNLKKILDIENLKSATFGCLNSIYKNLYKTCKSFYRLSLLHKVFLMLILLVFGYIIFNDLNPNNIWRNDNTHFVENYDGIKDSELYKPNFFEVKKENHVYDKLYSKYYDSIHLNERKNNFEIGKIIDLEKKKSNTKILDVGCGTGHHVDILKKKHYEVIGLDQSKDMIEQATEKYPACEFIEGNILNNSIFDYSSFSHILCLGRTIYLIKEKEKFFENCYSLLVNGGYLVVNLVNKKSFSPYLLDKTKKVLYDPEQYGKKSTQMIVKFDKNMEFFSEIQKSSGKADGEYIFKEKFENFNTHSVRKNEINMYMPDISQIVKLAKSKGFEFHKKFSMNKINHEGEYLYVFKK